MLLQSFHKKQSHLVNWRRLTARFRVCWCCVSGVLSSVVDESPDVPFFISASNLRFVFTPIRFYPNVTTLRSGLCYRKSVCRLSVTMVHPIQRVEPYGNISSPLYTLAIL